jgi:hypothetical protein
VIEVNHQIPFSWIELNPEEAVAGVDRSARSGLHCVGSQFVQRGGGRFHTFPPYEKNVAFICSSLDPHLRQWTRGGSADSGSKSSSTDWTTVDEIDRDLFTVTGFLGTEIRLAIAGTRHPRKVRGGKMR